ncbi:MAG: ABC transporter permease [Chloroflexota bacterium]
MSRILWLASWRYLVRHAWQVGLSALGIALGVAVVVSIDLANDSARRAFTLASETVAGRATHQVLAGPAGLPDDLYQRLRVELGVRPLAPVVEADLAAPDYPGRSFHLLGIDPFAEGEFRPYLSGNTTVQGDVLALLARPAAVLLSVETGRELGLRPGDVLVLRVDGARREATVVGLLEPADEPSRRALADLLIADVAGAQELLGQPGRLSRLDLIVPEGQAGEALLARLRAALPAGATVAPAGARAATLAQMTRAFDVNLTALSLLALLVGMFLIYNTMTFSVVQRRALNGTLRAVGVSRREVFALVLGEALLLGLVGTAIGLPLGIVLGRGLVGLVAQTINDLYFAVSVRDLAIAPLVLAKGTALGLGATLLAGLAPAWEATTAPPRAVLSRSLLEAGARRAAPRLALLGLLALALGLALLFAPSQELWLSFAALLVIVLGCALLTPLAVVALMALARPLLGLLWGTLGRLAARGVVASLSRTAVAIAALMVAVSVTVGVGVMVDSFRQTVVGWLEQTLQADVYVSAPGLVSNRPDQTLDPALVADLPRAPGVALHSTYRRVSLPAPEGPVELVALRLPVGPEGIAPVARAAFAFKEGDPAAIWPAFQSGEAVIISEPFAYRRGLAAGASLRLLTDRGERDFRVAGVFYDYGTDQGVVMLDRAAYERYWDDRAVSSLGLYVAPGVDVDDLVRRLRELAGEREVQIRSNRALRAASLEVFDRTFAITAVLRLLSTLVAFVGVLSALLALQLERAREVGVLRAQGLTPRQVWGLVTAQTGLMGLVAGLLALPVGLALATVLIHVINRRSFGWTLQMEVAPAVLLQAVLLALLAALLAGVYPAWRLSRTSPAVALREGAE